VGGRMEKETDREGGILCLQCVSTRPLFYASACDLFCAQCYASMLSTTFVLF
jgi:hypothetical protein